MSKAKSTPQGSRLVAAALVVFLLFMVFIIAPMQGTVLLSSLNPTFEGTNVQFFGIQLANSQQVLSPTTQLSPNCGGCVTTTNPTGTIGSDQNGVFSWSYDPNQPVISMTTQPPCSAAGTGQGCLTTLDLGVAIQAPISGVGCSAIQTDRGCQLQTLSYSVPDPANPTIFNQVVGHVVLYNFQITIDGVPTGSSQGAQLKGEALWFRIYSTTWNNYILPNSGCPNPPANPSTLCGAWTAPLVQQFLGGTNKYPSGTTPQNYATAPGILDSQEQISLFDAPQATANLPTCIGLSQIGAANQTIANGGSAYAPATCMSQVAYYKVTLSDFGGYACGFFNTAECTNNVLLNFQVYTLQLGSYLYTNPVTSSATNTANGCNGLGCFSNGLLDALAGLFTPLNISLILIVIIIVVALVFAGPALFSVRRAIG